MKFDCIYFEVRAWKIYITLIISQLELQDLDSTLESWIEYVII